MKTKLLLATLALTLLPSVSLAMGCAFGHAKTEDVVMSCADGTVFDTESGRCVPTTG